MTVAEVKEAIKEIPVGSIVQIIKKNGVIMEAILMSHAVEGTERKEYDGLVVPALPPALIMRGSSRFGNYRQETDELVNIVRVG